MIKSKHDMFDPEKFVQDVVTQNADALTTHFAHDAVICWHDSNEQFSVGEYVQANCEYPGDWQGKIQRVEKIEGGISMITKIWSEQSAHFVSAYIMLKDGKITRLDEYYSDLGEAPQWRKDMKIGKPIE
ncbi:MAG: nuclear transport factor 2 family protein [Defluviitaleaceae bacterium]|nr:nuclear transport factor 2 family protein [Defluviitaleaceae bacterium]